MIRRHPLEYDEPTRIMEIIHKDPELYKRWKWFDNIIKERLKKDSKPGILIKIYPPRTDAYDFREYPTRTSFLKKKEENKMIDEESIQVDIINMIYTKYGFHAVLNEVESRLTYGKLRKHDDGLYEITTGGWSEDEQLVHALINPASKFHYHYIGYLMGGAFYFDEDKTIESHRRIRIIKEKEEADI